MTGTVREQFEAALMKLAPDIDASALEKYPDDDAYMDASLEQGYQFFRLGQASNAKDAQDAARHIRMWLKAQANAETDPKAKAAFIEAHNAALAIIEDSGGRAAIDAAMSKEAK